MCMSNATPIRHPTNLDHMHADCRCGAAYGSAHRRGCLSLPEGDCEECAAPYGADHDAGCPVLTMHDREGDR